MLFTDEKLYLNSFNMENKHNVLLGEFQGIRPFIEKVSSLVVPFRPFRNASLASNAFYSFTTFDNAVKTYLNSPQQLVKFVQNELELMHKEEIGQDHWYDVSGDFIDVALLVEGQPEHFGNMYMGNPKRTFVTLILKLDISWSANVAYLQYYAARILRLIEWLERKEVRTKVVAYSSTEIEHLELLIKDYHEPLTLSSIAIIANADFYRRLIFRVRESSPYWNPTYGSTEISDSVLKKILPTLTKDRDSVIIYMDRNLYENNREVTDSAFDTTEEYLQRMLLDEERQGSIIV